MEPRDDQYPVQAVTVPGNLYIGASLVVKGDFAALGYVDNDWQSVYAQIPFDLAPCSKLPTRSSRRA